MFRCGHTRVTQTSQGFPKNPQRCRCRSKNALVNFNFFFPHCCFPLVPLRFMPCPNLWWHEKSSVLLSLSTTSYISWLSLTARTNTSVSMVWDEYSAMPRFHGSSVWFFLIEQRETDMAIATDVDNDDWRALSFIPAPLAPFKVGLMSTAVMANIFFSFSLGINHWKGDLHIYNNYYVELFIESLVSITNHIHMPPKSQITASVGLQDGGNPI